MRWFGPQHEFSLLQGFRQTLGEEVGIGQGEPAGHGAGFQLDKLLRGADRLGPLLAAQVGLRQIEQDRMLTGTGIESVLKGLGRGRILLFPERLLAIVPRRYAAHQIARCGGGLLSQEQRRGHKQKGGNA